MSAKGNVYCFWRACYDLRFPRKPLIGHQSVAKFLREGFRAGNGHPQSRSPVL
jgi:hypothetical protein